MGIQVYKVHEEIFPISLTLMSNPEETKWYFSYKSIEGKVLCISIICADNEYPSEIVGFEESIGNSLTSLHSIKTHKEELEKLSKKCKEMDVQAKYLVYIEIKPKN